MKKKTLIIILAIAATLLCASIAYAGNEAVDNDTGMIEKIMHHVVSQEKRAAIGHIKSLFEEYDRHYMMMYCVYLIVKAERNIDVIEQLAEYGITEDSGTLTYIKLAEYAARAPVADDEFIRLAEIQRQKGRGSVLSIARKAAKAETEAELKMVMKKAKRRKINW